MTNYLVKLKGGGTGWYRSDDDAPPSTAGDRMYQVYVSGIGYATAYITAIIDLVDNDKGRTYVF